MKKRWLVPVFASFLIFTSPILDAEATTTQDVTTIANQYLGIPYVWGGTTTLGFDCSGFTQRVFADLGYQLKRTAKEQYTQGKSVSKSQLQVGDLVFFNTSGRSVSHVGIYIGSNKFINAATSSGVTVSSLNNTYWKNRYVGAKRVVDFNNQQEVKGSTIDLNEYASRGEVAMRLAEALGVDTSSTNSSFVDVKSSNQIAGAVTALEKLGVFKGDGQGKFNPNSPITRAQLAKVLTISFHLKNAKESPLTFKDVSKNHWAYEYITTLATNGITIGKGDGLYGPNDFVTLSQLQTFIARSTNE